MRLTATTLLIASLAACAPCRFGDNVRFVARFENDTVGNPPSTTRKFGSTGAQLEVAGDALVFQPQRLGGSKAVHLKRPNFPPPTRLTATASAPVAFGTAYVQVDGYARNLGPSIGQAVTIRALAANGEPAATLVLYGTSYKWVDAAGTEYDLPGKYAPTDDHRLLLLLYPLVGKFDVCIDDEKVARDLPFESAGAKDVVRAEITLPMAITEKLSELMVDRVRIGSD